MRTDLKGRIFVTPVEDRTVRDLFGRIVPAQGDFYPDGSFWRRKLRAGDVTFSQGAPSARAKAPRRKTVTSKEKSS